MEMVIFVDILIVAGVFVLVNITVAVVAWRSASKEYDLYVEKHGGMLRDRACRHAVSRFNEYGFDSDAVDFRVYNGNI